jgi:23S rRNA (guanosine2251-2'-O)-methyltransferase
VHAVIVPKDRSAQLNATAKKVACGAAENVPLIRVTNLARTMRLLQEENIWIVGTAGEADHTLFQSKMTGPMALVMGAEGEGMRRLTREHCDELISIPMAGSVSSLNVSVATGICLFEAGTCSACLKNRWRSTEVLLFAPLPARERHRRMLAIRPHFLQ